MGRARCGQRSTQSTSVPRTKCRTPSSLCRHAQLVVIRPCFALGQWRIDRRGCGAWPGLVGSWRGGSTLSAGTVVVCAPARVHPHSYAKADHAPPNIPFPHSVLHTALCGNSDEGTACQRCILRPSIGTPWETVRMIGELTCCHHRRKTIRSCMYRSAIVPSKGLWLE